jgi:hypothetical protein
VLYNKPQAEVLPGRDLRRRIRRRKRKEEEMY